MTNTFKVLLQDATGFTIYESKEEYIVALNNYEEELKALGQ